MFRILVADNYPLHRMGICQTLDSHFPEVELCEAACVKDVMKQLKLKRFDLLLLALSHPGTNTIEMLRTIKLKHPKTPILVMCIYPESVYGYRALSSGASGYITRETTVNDLVFAVNKILKGDSYISRTLAKNMLAKIGTRTKVSSVELLSNRELQILQLMATGKKTNLIASETNLSVSTVGTYRQRIFTKLDIRTHAELTRFAIDNALV
jgi:two-component system, NarL family, invasion response regulator UvrY